MMLKTALMASGIATAIILSSGMSTAQATTYELVPITWEYIKTLPTHDQNIFRQYKSYEEREPCQHYMPLPPEIVSQNCRLYHVVAIPDPVIEIAVEIPVQPQVISSYEVFFPLNSAALDLQAQAMVDKAASDIATFQPSSVTVAGHTDTSGTPTYNDQLSAERALSVSQALRKHGVEHTVLDLQAWGQKGLKVPTADHVREPLNRRTVIEFLR